MFSVAALRRGGRAVFRAREPALGAGDRQSGGGRVQRAWVEHDRGSLRLGSGHAPPASPAGRCCTTISCDCSPVVDRAGGARRYTRVRPRALLRIRELQDVMGSTWRRSAPSSVPRIARQLRTDVAVEALPPTPGEILAEAVKSTTGSQQVLGSANSTRMRGRARGARRAVPGASPAGRLLLAYLVRRRQVRCPDSMRGPCIVRRPAAAEWFSKGCKKPSNPGSIPAPPRPLICLKHQ